MKKNELIKKIKEIETLSNDEKTALIELLSSQKRYGLVWEDKPEAMEEELRHKLPILKEVVDKRIIADSTQAQSEENDNNLFAGQESEKSNQNPPNHILIEGDNLHALSVLNYTHAGKVDVIYIDPPYNTGNKDFKYNDRFVDKEDSYRHSKWLSFMNKRLKLAKNLLKDSGVIFISIDDNEQAQLKLLCDEVFGEENFIGEIIRKTKSMTGDEGAGFNLQHENLIIFSKNKSLIFLNGDEKDFNNYKNPDNDPNGAWVSGDPSAKSGGETTYFEVVNPFTNSIQYPPDGRYWAFSKDSLLKYIAKGKIKFKEKHKDNERNFIFKRYKNELKTDKNPVNSLFAIENEYLNQVGTKECQSIFFENKFNNPKPSYFIKKLMSYSTNNSSTVLDFFAGSGTTLHATMQLNAEDGGNRQCILVTNNENNIAEEVCYERNKRVINGYTKPNGDKVAGLKNNNLRYYKTEFVDSAKTLKNRTKVMELAKDMLCIKDDCYNEITDLSLLTDNNLTKSKIRLFENEKIYLMIVYDEQEIDNAVEIIKTLDKKVNVYIFSAGQYPFTDDFEEVLDKVELCALPEAIYKAYKSILPKKKAEVLIETELEEIEPKENESYDLVELEGN